MRASHWAWCAAVMATGGCASLTSLVGLTKPVTSVTVELTLDGKPMHAAHLRAVPMNAGPVPLPVTAENLEEYLYATGDSASTDEHGRAILRLHDASPHLIEVSPSPLGPNAAMERVQWVIDAGSSEPRPAGPLPPGIVLKSVKLRS